MDGRGGARPGAGRKPGSRDKTTEAIEAMAVFAGRQPEEIRPEIAAMSPLEVLLRAMGLEANAGNWTAAAEHAAKAAPYLHPRLASTQLSATIGRELREMTDDELMAVASGALPPSG